MGKYLVFQEASEVLACSFKPQTVKLQSKLANNDINKELTN